MSFDIEDYELPGESPFYTDFLYKVQEDYPNAGIGVTFDNVTNFETKLPRTYIHKDEIVALFNLKYKYHEIGSETESMWQYQINKVFEQIKNKYERYFTLYETKDINELGKLISENINRYGTGDRDTTSESDSTNKDKFNDTPISELMENANYASSITDGENHNESTGNIHSTYADTVTTKKDDRDKSNMELVDKNMKIWKDLIVSYVDEFRNCFMDTFARI